MDWFFAKQINNNSIIVLLGCTIAQVPATLEVPVNEFDGKVIYGEKKKAKEGIFKGHADQLAPTVDELLKLEKRIQSNYLKMKFASGQKSF